MLWLVTFVTHNSRVSRRMATYHVQPGESVILTPDEQRIVASAIAAATRKGQVTLGAYNILPDHVHLIIESDSEVVLADHIRRIKGYTAHAVRQARSLRGGCHIWAQKFNRRQIPDGHALYRTIQYVMDNHLKHLAQWGDRLITTWDEEIRPVVESACTPLV